MTSFWLLVQGWRGLDPLMLLSSALGGALVIRLLLLPRRTPRILPSQLPGPGSAPARREHRFLTVARRLFGDLPWLGRWYPGVLARPDRRLYAGLEDEAVSTLVGLHLVAGGLGMLVALVLLLLLSASPVVLVWGVFGAGLFYGLIWPSAFFTRRMRQRDEVMALELVPWVRAIMTQLAAKKVRMEALRLATEVLARSEPADLPGHMTDLYGEAQRMLGRLAGRQVPSASAALAEMAARCHQVTVVNTILALQFAEENGTPLLELLRALEAGIVQEIASALELVIERRQVQATALTTIVAFVVLVGTIGGIIVTQFLIGFGLTH